MNDERVVSLSNGGGRLRDLLKIISRELIESNVTLVGQVKRGGRKVVMRIVVGKGGGGEYISGSLFGGRGAKQAGGRTPYLEEGAAREKATGLGGIAEKRYELPRGKA